MNGADNPVSNGFGVYIVGYDHVACGVNAGAAEVEHSVSVEDNKVQTGRGSADAAQHLVLHHSLVLREKHTKTLNNGIIRTWCLVRLLLL